MFSPPHIFDQTMQNFKRAVLAYGDSIKVFRTTRKGTRRKKHVPQRTLDQFKKLITFEPSTYAYALAQEFEAACAAASSEADAHTLHTAVYR